ncbi:MAG: AAA family ATPase, partial [Syntrophorhabdaceae bacterium]|nr:AAA family ATPase [Syntrophorhabdaceae bacterium]
FLPDKAIDLVDEAASRLKIELDSVPTGIDEVERQKKQLEMERFALSKEEDEASRERLRKIEEEIADLRNTIQALRERWDQEKLQIADIRAVKDRLEQATSEMQRAEREGNLEKASQLKYGVIPALQKQIEKASNPDVAGASRLLKEEVDEEDVAGIVSRWTGIPISRLVEGEVKKLLTMEDRLCKRVVGQDDAVRLVSDAVRRAKSGLKDPRRPIGSFLFLGPTGVGKTELARALAEFLFDDEAAMVRLDMSEYMEKHSVARMIGAPPGYIGYDEGGALTEAIRRKPYTVILFDEIEKAHPDVFHILLQVLEDGRLTDGQGRTVDFRNSVAILTSNAGSQWIQEMTGKGDDEIRAGVMEELRRVFRPEFLNRLDEIILFRSLGKESLARIVEIMVKELNARLAARMITVDLTEAARARLAEIGYDPVFGARPLRRAIQKNLQDTLAIRILSGEFREGDKVAVDVDEKGGFTFSRE